MTKRECGRVRATLAAAMAAAMLAGLASGTAVAEERQRGRDEAPGAPVACMEAARNALRQPQQFRWVGAKTRKVAEDAYSVVGDVEYVRADGQALSMRVQCDVLRAPGDQFVVAKLRAPAP
jgi:hypothetical protein